MSWYQPVLITIIAVVLFSAAGIGRIMGWGQEATADTGDLLALDPMAPVAGASEAHMRPRCPECGVIVSVREILGLDEDSGPGAAGGTPAGNGEEMRVTAARNYEITVRMADGSSRVDNYSGPANWRSGDPVIVIGGADPSHP